MEWPIALGSTPGRAGSAFGAGPESASDLLSITEYPAQSYFVAQSPLAIGVAGVTGLGRALVFTGRLNSFTVTQSTDGSVLCLVKAPDGSAFTFAPVVSPAGVVIAATTSYIIAVPLQGCTSSNSPVWTLPRTLDLNLPAALNLLGDVLLVASLSGATGKLEAFPSLSTSPSSPPTVLWSVLTPGPISGAPVVLGDGNTVVYSVGGSLFAVSGADGTPLWGPVSLPSQGALSLLLSAGSGKQLLAFAQPTTQLYVVDGASGSYDVFNVGVSGGVQAPMLSPACFKPSSGGAASLPCVLYLAIGNSVLALSLRGTAVAQLWSTSVGPVGSTATLCAIGSDGVVYGTVSGTVTAGAIVGLLPSGDIIFSKSTTGQPSLGCAISSDTNAIFFSTPTSSSLYALTTLATPPPPSAAATYDLGAILGGVFGGLVLLSLAVAFFTVPAFRASLQVIKRRRVRVRRVTLVPHGSATTTDVYSPLIGNEGGGSMNWA